MANDYDREKVIDCMFDPVTSSIIAELENGKQFCDQLAQKCSIAENEVKERLSYLIEHDFISEKSEGQNTIFEANHEKLASLVENGDQFDGAIDGLTKMDGYLN